MSFAQDDAGGVGIYLDFDPPGSQNLVVYSVTYKSPADKAKVKRGDQLIKVDAQQVQGKSLAEVASLIRGPAGSPVVLTVMRGGASIDIPLVRQVMSTKVKAVLPPPSQIDNSRFLNTEEKSMLKQKIMALKTPEQKQRMLELLTAFKDKSLSKPNFLKAIRAEFP